MKRNKEIISIDFDNEPLTQRLDKYNVYTLEERRHYEYLLTTIRELKGELWCIFGIYYPTSINNFKKTLIKEIKFRLNRKAAGLSYLPEDLGG